VCRCHHRVAAGACKRRTVEADRCRRDA
jgi:hypothetical protein